MFVILRIPAMIKADHPFISENNYTKMNKLQYLFRKGIP